MAKSKTKVKTDALTVPQDDVQCANDIARIGNLQRRIDAQKADADEQLATIAKALEDARQPVLDEIQLLQRGVAAYCEANRDRLTDGGKRKFFDFASGRISWRIKPPKVKLKNVAAVIEELRSCGMERFLRTKTEVNKEAILAEPTRLGDFEGVKIVRDEEEFIIDPAELKASEVAA
ncbi:MAG: host-nuclease inhibitor Gam family protein [Pseudomonadota bacterium]